MEIEKTEPAGHFIKAVPGHYGGKLDMRDPSEFIPPPDVSDSDDDWDDDYINGFKEGADYTMSLVRIVCVTMAFLALAAAMIFRAN